MKKRIMLAASAALLILNSCTKEEIDLTNVDENLEASASNQVKACLDVVFEDVEGREGKALLEAKLWDVGETITVRFLGGSASLQARVFAIAEQWEEYANIDFQRVNSGNADIRVAFEDGGSWSYLGTDARRINQNNQTMNFGWFDDNSSTAELERTTLHEFGHALGAIHEHMSPENDIQWDVDAVYEQYARYGWDRDQVDNNLFRTYSSSQVTNSAYDPLSIMHYPIDQSLTLNNFSVGWNRELSTLDKQFIGETYPFDDTTNPGGGDTFPDPSKTYYIENKNWNVRIGANGSQDAFTTGINTTGDNVEWRISPSPTDGYYYIDCVGGGSVPRLRSDQTVLADMQGTGSAGTWTRWSFTDVGDDYYYLTTLNNSDFSRLQVDNVGSVRTVAQNFTADWTHFKFVEVD